MQHKAIIERNHDWASKFAIGERAGFFKISASKPQEPHVCYSFLSGLIVICNRHSGLDVQIQGFQSLSSLTQNLEKSSSTGISQSMHHTPIPCCFLNTLGLANLGLKM